MTRAAAAPDVRSLVELLRFRAQVQTASQAYVFLTDGEVEGQSLSYGEVDRRSRAVAAALQAERAAGERALLLYPPGLDFVAAFFGCLYAGVVAVPIPPPHPARPGRSLPRLGAIARDAEVRFVLTTAAIAALAPALARETRGLATARWVATAGLGETDAEGWREPIVGPDALAFLQYTSGSTASPKGVMVSHGNLLHNLACIHGCAENDADTVSVSWLPVYHDMGLIEGLLAPVFGGYPAYLMAPTAFLQKPLRWLRAIAGYGATNSGGPNFAYDLCVRKTTPEEREGLDLSRWRVAYNGAEPIRSDTLERFHRAFRPCGFRWRAFYPVYGLAEGTLVVSSGRRAYEPVFHTVRAAALAEDRVVQARGPDDDSLRLVACGPPSFGTTVAIVDPDRCVRRAPGRVGEIWVRGPSVAHGYWNRPDATAATFHAYLGDTGEGPFLRTGDLGFLAGDDLVVTGRLKDVVIVRGRKLYPQDLELTAERSHPAIRPGCVAAFAAAASGGGERVVLLAEVDPHDVTGPDGLLAVVGAIREAVTDQHELSLDAVALLAPGGVPKTTSGKLQRHAGRTAFAAGTLDVLGQWVRLVGEPGVTVADAPAVRR
jgi:acyl-CoA synthetase (AMP-forming)/AMP-acid ligase II